MYKLTDSDRERRLAELRADDPGALGDEIALLRCLIEEQTNLGNVPMVNALIATLQRCASAHEAAQLRAKQYLPRSELLFAAGELCRLIYERVASIPGYESVLDGVIDDFQQLPILLEDKR